MRDRSIARKNRIWMLGTAVVALVFLGFPKLARAQTLLKYAWSSTSNPRLEDLHSRST